MSLSAIAGRFKSTWPSLFSFYIAAKQGIEIELNGFSESM